MVEYTVHFEQSEYELYSIASLWLTVRTKSVFTEGV